MKNAILTQAPSLVASRPIAHYEAVNPLSDDQKRSMGFFLMELMEKYPPTTSDFSIAACQACFDAGYRVYTTDKEGESVNVMTSIPFPVRYPTAKEQFKGKPVIRLFVPALFTKRVYAILTSYVSDGSLVMKANRQK